MSAAKGTTIQRLPGTSTLVRPKFGPGMLLQHDDLEQLANYTRDLSRLMFRSLFGCGVVCGLKVGVEENHCGLVVTVDAGLAIDCLGDPLEIPKSGVRIAVNGECEGTLIKLWVLLCGSSKCCAPRSSACGSGEETPSVCTRERLGYEIRIVSDLPDCFCGLRENDRPSCFENNQCACVNPAHPAYIDHYQGKCGCNCAGSECCCCDCVILAVLLKPLDKPWTVDHHVRRVTRPVLMCDWLERPATPAGSTMQQSPQQTTPSSTQQPMESTAQEAAQPLEQAAEPMVAESAEPAAEANDESSPAAQRTPTVRRPRK